MRDSGVAIYILGVTGATVVPLPDGAKVRLLGKVKSRSDIEGIAEMASSVGIADIQGIVENLIKPELCDMNSIRTEVCRDALSRIQDLLWRKEDGTIDTDKPWEASSTEELVRIMEFFGLNPK